MAAMHGTVCWPRWVLPVELPPAPRPVSIELEPDKEGRDIA